MKFSALSFLVLTFAVSSYADQVVVGEPPDYGFGNCDPFGCNYDGEYEQVYSSTQFSGPITITSLEFFNTAYNSGSTLLPTGTYTISLSETSANWNTISDTFSANLGADNTEVFSGSISQAWAFGDTLTIALSTPFTYNPASGNLLLNVVTNSAAGLNYTYFDDNGYNLAAFNGDTFLGRVYCQVGTTCGSTGAVNNGYGLVTGFVTDSDSTPEPGTLGLMALGFVAAAALRRRTSG